MYYLPTEENFDWGMGKQTKFEIFVVVGCEEKIKQVLNASFTLWNDSEALEPIGSYTCNIWSLTQFMKDEVARSISTPCGWDASPSQVIPLQFGKFLQQFTGGERYCEGSSVLPKNTMQCPRPGLKSEWSRDKCTNHEATAPPTFFMPPTVNHTYFVKLL